MRIIIVLCDVIVAAVMGLIAAVAILPIAAVVLVVFAFGVLVCMYSRVREGQTRFAVRSAMGAAVVFCGILAGAALYRPTKVVERKLASQVRIPATEMTLAELAYAAKYDRWFVPLRMSFCFADGDKELVVRWPREELTLGEFLNAIESQTALRGRFMHCGNGYTVLGGGDCSFGLDVCDPNLAVPPFKRDRFDLDAYLADRESRLIER